MKRAADEPKNDNHAAATPSPNIWLVNSRRSSIGARTLSSHQMNPAIRTATATPPTITGVDSQPNPLPLPTTSKRTRSITPETAAPVQSNEDAPCPR